MSHGASNFSFLAAEWPQLHAEAARAESAAHGDPRTACFYARRTLELAVAWIFRVDRSLKPPYKADLSAFLFEPTFKALVGPALHAKMDIVRRQGNLAVHSSRVVSALDATGVLRELFHVMYWLARQYGRSAAARPTPDLEFRAELLRVTTPEPTHSQAALEKLAAQLAERDAAVAAAQQKAAGLDVELARLRKEVAAAKAANTTQPDTHDYSEAQTRDLYIDLLLKEAGWVLDQPRDREFEVRGMPNAQGKGYVDYVLWGDDGKPLALVEAKRCRRDATEGRQQAKLYADCLELQFGQRPMIYCTNGYEHFFWDDTKVPERPVQGFHKKDELQLMVHRRTERSGLAAQAINKAIVERHYQHRAIRYFGRHAGHRHRRARSREPGLFQAGALENQVLADGGARYAPVPEPVRAGPGQAGQDFLIFDFCQNLEFFGKELSGAETSAGKPLSQRLFLTRLKLLGALDRFIAAEGTVAGEGWRGEGIRLTEPDVRADAAAQLRQIVAGMNIDNFVVRPQRRWVERWNDPDLWNRATETDLAEAAQHLFSLPSTVRDEDEEAKRFDLLLLHLQLCVLKAASGFERLRNQVQGIASALLELDNIPAVQAQLRLIEKLAGDEWWQDVTVPMLEQARRHLRSLVKLLEARRKAIVYSNFEDEIGEATPVALPVAAGDAFERFRLKARAFLRSHEDHLALHKLRRNQPLTASDLAELERMLTESGTGSAQEIAQATSESHGLGLFVRSLIGLDRQAASQALDQFVKGRRLGADQLQFIDMVIGHLTENGIMEAGALYESPFTSVAPLGPDQLFDKAEVRDLIRVLESVEATARVA